MQKTQRGLALFLVFLLVFTSFPLSSFAVTVQTDDSVTFNSTIEGGDDGVTNYKFLKPVIHITDVPAGYIAIYTAEDFFNIRNDLTQNYILMNNIDLSQYSCWIPIDQFEGILDGNGYEITNLYIDNSITNSSSAYAGLFGSTKGTIKNLGIGSGNIDIVLSDPVNLDSNLSYIGTITGILDYDGKIVNCYSYCDIETNVVSIEIGGIIGMLYYGQDSQLDCCYNIGKITSTTGGTLGGIVGLLYYSTDENNTITNCENYGSLNGSCALGYGVDAGGIIGQSYTAIKLDTCVNYGQISSKNSVGGILGSGVETKVYYCENYGDISSLNSAGGIIGEVRKTARIEFSKNFGDVDARSRDNSQEPSTICAGGIIGKQAYHGLFVFDCANFGNIVAKEEFKNSDKGGLLVSNSPQGAFAGGILGYVDEDSNTPTLWIERCYNMSKVIEAVNTSYDIPSYSYTTYVCSSGIIAYGHTYNPIVRDCYNTAKITATGNTSNSKATMYTYAGGILGEITNWSDGYKPQIESCYNVGIIHSNGAKAENTFGGSIGACNYDEANLKNCYYLDTTGSALNTGLTDGCTPLTQSQLSIKDNYNGFDFDNIWTMDGLESYRYPELINMPIPSEDFGEVTPEYNAQALSFENKVAFIDIGENIILNVHIKDVSVINGKIIYSNDQIISNENLVWSVATGFDNIIEVTKDGTIKGLSNGLAILSARHKDDINLSTTCFVYVGKPNTLENKIVYDTKQYYAEGGFYSEVSSISDCVELYMSFNNKMAEELESIDYNIKEDGTQEYFAKISPIKLTATVNGMGMSFDRNSYQNTYTTILDEISVQEAVDDILMLFPYNLNVASSGNNYTVTVTLESESFETITDEYSFTIENLETKSANEHIDFVSSNKDYKVSKQNIYGETMVTLKNDAEYKWSKYSTFDFENYYEVVFADILIELMNTSQLGHVSLLPVVKEWVGNYKTILSEVSTIVEDDYTGYLNVTENAIDKVLKKSKYTTEGMDVHDEIRDLVVLKLRDKVSIDKVNSAFAAIDKTQQYFSFFELSVDITNDIADFIDGVSVLNAYKEMDDEFKAVIQNLYNQIPSSEKKLKDAVYHYVNVDSYLGYSSEILNEVRNMAGDITLDVFNTVYKKQVLSSICKSIGNIQLKSGALFSSTAAFSGISTAIGSFTTGVQLGLCISDILCDSSGKSEEMSKVVAMSEFSPYVINTLNHYESKLYTDRNDTAVTYYEYAFAMHKATQRYIMQHTVNSLEIKRDSLIIKLFGRDDYNGLINDILVQKRSIDNLECHNTNPSSSVVTETKVIAIKCPVNVFIYDESGKEVVRIVNDIKEYVSGGIDVFVENGEKYIALPTDQKYSVKIIATDSGSMAYTVTEYGSGAERLRTVKKDNIPLVKNRKFTGQIVVPMNVAPESYALTYDNKTVIADNVVNVPVTGIQLDVDNITMDIGETKKLFATVNPNNATNKGVTWSSDNPNVVEIDKDGNITALAIGVATITVSSDDWGFIDTCTITVSCAHTPANAWSTDSEHHWKECTIVGCGIVIDASKATHIPDHQGGATEEYAIKCSVCGYIIEAQLNHTHVFDKEVAEEQYLASKANCTEPAKYYKSCKCCEKGTETFASGEALGHTEGTEWKSDAENHWHACSVAGCGVIIDNSKAAHTPDREEATETDPIKCSVCGYVITPAFGHTHAHGADWKSDKDNHWNECTCGDKTNTAAHNDANKDGKCDICEYEVGTITPDPDTIPDDTNKPSDDVQSPQTGDNSMMWLWIALLIVSGFGMIATIVMRKKFVR